MMNLDVGSVHGSQDESSIHDKLHVAGSWGFGSCSGNVLTKFWGGYDDFGIGDIVVG